MIKQLLILTMMILMAFNCASVPEKKEEETKSRKKTHRRSGVKYMYSIMRF